MRETPKHLENLRQAHKKLLAFVGENPDPSEVVRAGIIQAFEFTFELFWKFFQKLAIEEGLSANSPKSALKAVFKLGLLQNEGVWLDMLEDRNLTVHTYKEDLAKAIYDRITQVYLAEMQYAQEAIKSKTGF